VKTEGGTVALDREKIESDARYDGKWVLRTNTALSTADVAQAYKGLWRVEQAFRTLKTPLELRPIYHWTEKRIRGHLVVCFLAFLLRTVLKQRLDDAGWEGSFTAVLEDLSHLRAVTIASPNGERYRMRDEIPASLLPVFHALKIASPRRLEKLD
jgi:transposase